MKTAQTIFLATLAISLIICLTSCNVKEKEAPSEGDDCVELADFQPIMNYIDVTQENKFDESNFYGEWYTSKTIREVYVDGVLTESYDDTGNGVYVKGLRIPENHNDGVITWLYAYNCILIKSGVAYSSFVVERSEPGKLCLRKEILPVGGPVTLFFKDPSGTHHFDIYELLPK